MAAGMMLGMMRATAPAPGLALWTLGHDHTSADYCSDYVPLVKAYLDPYRAPVSQETHEQVSPLVCLHLMSLPHLKCATTGALSLPLTLPLCVYAGEAVL